MQYGTILHPAVKQELVESTALRSAHSVPDQEGHDPRRTVMVGKPSARDGRKSADADYDGTAAWWIP